MPRSLLAAYCVLGALSLLYLGLVHLPSRARGRSLHYFPKEFAIALLFAAASALPRGTRRDVALRACHGTILCCCSVRFLPLLCWLNCVAIEDWEQHRRGNRIRWLAGLSHCRPVASAYFELVNQLARWLAVAAILSAVLFLASRPFAVERPADGASQPISPC